MLSRRSFLKWVGGAAAAVTAAKVLPAVELDPEKLLWVPGKKKIFIPELDFSRAAFTTDLYNQEALKQLQRQLNFAQSQYLDKGVCRRGTNGDIHLQRFMIDGQGLMVPVTPEGYRAGYEIYENLLYLPHDLRIETHVLGEKKDAKFLT